MFDRRTLKSMLTALAAAGLVTLASGSAFAAAPAAEYTAASRIGTAIPNATNFFWTYKLPGEHTIDNNARYECAQGVDYPQFGQPPVQNPVESVANNCEYRVYLQYADGHSDCINPHTSKNIVDSINWDPDGVMIGNSTNNC
jgi:hypothetical protein